MNNQHCLVSRRGVDPLWTRKARVLLERPREFVPTREHSVAEKCNACVRFTLYGMMGLVVSRASANRPIVPVLVLGLLAVVLLTQAAKSAIDRQQRLRPSRPSDPPGCRLPTEQNPFGNRLPGEDPSGQGPCTPSDGPEAMERVYEALQRVAPHVANDRQFYTAPNLIPDTQKFIDFVYPQTPICKQTTAACYPPENRPPGR